MGHRILATHYHGLRNPTIYVAVGYGIELHFIPILDSYSAHRAPDVLNVAVGYRIELHFIPPGMTGRLQPLDRYVFGALKSACRRLFDRHCIDHPMADVDRPLAVQFLMEAWERISVEVPRRAWTIYTEEADDRYEEWAEVEE
jgi:hypothetical protein